MATEDGPDAPALLAPLVAPDDATAPEDDARELDSCDAPEVPAPDADEEDAIARDEATPDADASLEATAPDEGAEVPGTDDGDTDEVAPPPADEETPAPWLLATELVAAAGGGLPTTRPLSSM